MNQQKIALLKQRLGETLRNSHSHEWDEQAIPSYCHPNVLVRRVFWRRIAQAFSLAPAGEVVLDFGHGAGAMLPYLQQGYRTISIYDKDQRVTAVALANAQALGLQSVNVVKMQEEKFLLDDNSVDTIFALDVLEHVENLPSLLQEFHRILKPTGKLIVCSPTENFVYRLVRKFGGPGYQGEFHLRAAREVEADLKQFFQVKLKRRIFPGLVFFRIVAATKSRSPH